MIDKTPLNPFQRLAEKLLGLASRFRDRFARHKGPKQLDGIGVQGPRYGNKFDQVDPALSTLVFCDEGLRFPEFRGQWLLPDASILPHSNKHGDEPGVFRRFK